MPEISGFLLSRMGGVGAWDKAGDDIDEQRKKIR